MHRAEAAEARSPEPLRPETVRITAGGERCGGLAGQVVPAHRHRGDQRAGRPPHEVLGFVGEVRANQRSQVVFAAETQPARDEEDPGLAGEEPGGGRLRDGLARHVVRLGTPALERTSRDGTQIERRHRETGASQTVECEDHSCRPDVEVLQRQRSLVAVPLVRGPELVGIERGVRIRDHRGDAAANARLVPRFSGEPLERARVVEHG